jgi:hypothetical protein
MRRDPSKPTKVAGASVAQQPAGDSPETSPRHPMTAWYDPMQLVRTGINVAISTIFARNSDPRPIEALAVSDPPLLDYSGNIKPGGFWIDYVSDTGDGYDATYAVARAIAQPVLRFTDEDRKPIETSRGDVLLFGGDQVYPVASRDAYHERLESVYREAWDKMPGPEPDVYAIPGNHDWYDNLVAFSRLFCTARKFARSCTRQCRSYFALKLPHNWWLFAVDVQLESDLDAPQINYFKSIIDRELNGESKIILCTAEPHWIYHAAYGQKRGYTENNLWYLENELIRDKGKIFVFLAGDLHHYRRHEEPTHHVQKIACGGGGAFLHPTHAPKLKPLGGGFEQKTSYPTQNESRRLALNNLVFPLRNPTFGLATALLYVITAWMAPIDVSGLDWRTAMRRIGHQAFSTPILGLWFVLVVGGFWLFTDTHSRPYRFFAGLVHGVAHLMAALSLKWISQLITIDVLGLPYDSTGRFLLSALLIAGMGWLAGAELMGLYLLVSVNLFRRHSNEAFSALRIADYKSFVRLCIDDEGALTIHAIGIDRVARASRDAPPPDPNPQLIEIVRIVPQRGQGRQRKASAMQQSVRKLKR